MEKSETVLQYCINWRSFLLLGLLVLVCYGNTFNAYWHLDDFHNINNNPAIHAEDLFPESIYNAAFGTEASGMLFFRPVSYLSFALNWYFGKTDVTGYHIVNITIHILTAIFLYITILALFDSPNLEGKYRGSEHFIALLAASLWAVNPIQIQAVTYIVQRMASMAAMFYIFGIYLYIKARTSRTSKRRALYLAGVLFAFLLAVGTKENSLLLPVSLFFLEMIFFRDMSDITTRNRFLYFGLALVVITIALGILLFMHGGVIVKYETRTFSFLERVLTQPRIIIFYISQIFYPIADRFSIDHDVIISKGLFNPWTTLPSIISILFLILLAFWQIIKNPLVSFAILFFFLNHVVESSVIPLELIFEHRNYLPSMFLFLPIAAGVKWTIDYYSNRKKGMALTLICFTSLLIMILGMGTYTRNMVWVDEKTLWQDAVKKAPGRARPYQNLASSYYSKINEFDKALELYEKAASLKGDRVNGSESLSLLNMASMYARKKEYQKALDLYERVLSLVTDKRKTYHDMVITLVHEGMLEKALENMNKLLEDHADSVRYLNLKAFILLKLNKPEEAMVCLKKIAQTIPGDEQFFLNMGKAKNMIGKYQAAEYYFTRVPEKSSNRLMAFFLLVENSLYLEDNKRADMYVRKMMSQFSSETIITLMKRFNTPEGNMLWPISTNMVAPVIAATMRKKSDIVLNLGKADGS